MKTYSLMTRASGASPGVNRSIRWRLQVQPIKMKLVHFRNYPRRQQKTHLTINIDGQTASLANETQYFGVTFDRALNFKTHLKELKKKTSSRIGFIRYLARNIEDHSTHTFNNLHKSLIRSVTTYA